MAASSPYFAENKLGPAGDLGAYTYGGHLCGAPFSSRVLCSTSRPSSWLGPRQRLTYIKHDPALSLQVVEDVVENGELHHVLIPVSTTRISIPVEKTGLRSGNPTA